MVVRVEGEVVDRSIGDSNERASGITGDCDTNFACLLKVGIPRQCVVMTNCSTEMERDTYTYLKYWAIFFGSRYRPA